ncbi:MAG: peptidoglycan-binding protein [Candidatus Rokubacteria bacterium]|nr:peptidoglycan-binding protein [Candidatus Rokubacteria bacterium]
MESWKRITTLTVAVLLVAGPAWAQGTSTSGEKAKPGTSASGPAASGTTDKADKGGTAGTMDKAEKRGEMAKGDRDGKGGTARGGQNQEQIKAVQEALKDKGHDPGEIDGLMGPKTKAALRDFQQKEGLKESGRLDKETMAKLGVEMKAGAADTSSPAASPGTGDKSGAAPGSAPSTGGAQKK